MIYGNIDGIRNTVLERLDTIYEHKIPRESFFTQELIELLGTVTAQIEREISVVVDRKGNISSVAIGDSTTVEIPMIDIAEKKLSGVRIVHTHPNGNSKLSALDMSALLKFKLDAIAAIGVGKEALEVTLGFCDVENEILVEEMTGPLSVEDALELNILDKIKHIEELIKGNNIIEDHSEKAILVGIENEESLEELQELARACDVQVLNKVLQKRTKVDSAFYIGKGKVEEIGFLRQSLGANMIIFDDELLGSQVRNLEEALGVKVIDRTTLILDIFARRARSRESKIQVELAQLKYRAQRLMGLGTMLSRTGGGIGTRGPGEKKLETDRRHIKEKIYTLLEELEKIKKTREVQREKRNKEDIPKIALVGYTNAGKSTLRNKLCDMAMPKDMTQKEKVFVADMLFATLDITTRAIHLPDNRLVTLTDTVGFVRKLPHDLVEAFKSTLEEVIYTDLLVHVVDASAPNAMEQIQAVNDVLTQLKASDKPTLLVLNKVDQATKEDIEKIKETWSDNKILEISATQNINLELLLEEAGRFLPNKLKEVEYLIPYIDASMVAFLHRNGKVKVEEYKEEGTYILAQVDEEVLNKSSQYII